MRWLGRLLPPGSTPRLLFEDHEHHIIGMEAVPQPHRNWKEMLLDGELHDRHVRQFAVLLACLHRLGHADGDAVSRTFGDRTFFESLRIEAYYAYTASRVPDAAAFLLALIDETRACRLTLVHGDYSPKNVLVHEDRLVLLDHEVMHFGEPAFDLGFSLTHLLSKAHRLPSHREAFGRAARLHWDCYSAEIGGAVWRGGLEQRAIRHTLACLLARAAGRSPLEYLSPAARQRQQEIVTALLSESLPSLPSFIEAFLARL